MLCAIAYLIAFICVVTAFIDMGMNGSAYADWAPKALVIAGISLVVCGLFG